MPQHKLDECLDFVRKTFAETDNKYESHLKCYPTLHRMAEDDEIIFEVLRRNMMKPQFFSKTHCTPDFQFTLLDEPDCYIFVNFFGPNKEMRTDVSYSTMHHHDDYLLSTINAKGEGYKSLIFKQGYNINKEEETAEVALEKYVLHAPRNIEFIDCHTNHCIFYPESITMTYGLWSTFFPTSRLTKITRSNFVQTNKAGIKKVLDSIRLNPKKLGVAQYREDYFYPEDGILKFLSDQILPENGDHYVQNFFHVLKEFLSFSDNQFLKDLHTTVKKEENGDQITWVEKAIENEPIERNYNSYEMYVDKRNVNISEYKKIYKF